MARIPLPIHSYRVSGSSSRLVNCYAELMPTGASKGPVRLITAPGVASFATLPAGEGRGMATFAGDLYAVVGDRAYRVADDGTGTDIGLISGSGPVGMAAGVNNLVIAAGVDGYTVAPAGNVTAIADGDWRACDSVDFLDSYIIGVERSSPRWFSSDLAAETAYDPLYFATAEGAPDDLLTLIADHRQAILFGAESTELWYNSGQEGFPFERSPNGFLELGIAGKRAALKLDNSVFWIANDKTVRRLDGMTPLRVSTHAVEEALRGATLTDCRAFAYQSGGHLFAVFRLPECCFVFDVTTGEWHERQTYGQATWQAIASAVAYGETFVLHPTTGAVGRVDATIATELGAVLRPEWTYQPVYGDNEMMFHSRLEIDVETGAEDIGEVAEVQLSVSDDGGANWRGFPDRALGLTGDFRKRLQWNRLGRSRQRVYRAAVSSPVPLAVTGTFVEVQG